MSRTGMVRTPEGVRRSRLRRLRRMIAPGWMNAQPGGSGTSVRGTGGSPRSIGTAFARVGNGLMRIDNAMSPEPSSLLLVDDEELNREGLARRLRGHGYAVTIAKSGREAI